MTTTEGVAHPEFLVETEALEQRLDAPELRILHDASRSRPENHLPGRAGPG